LQATLVRPTHCALVRLVLAQAAEAVEGGYFVTFREGGVVEDGVDKVVDCAPQSHDGLADMDEFCSVLSDDVDAENFPGLSVEDEFEPAGGISANLATGNFAIVGHADFVGNVFVGQLLFSLSDEADLGNGVDAVWIEAGIRGSSLVVECAGCGDAALLHGDRSKSGKSDDIAGSEDMFDLGLVVLVYGDAAAIVGFEAGFGKVEVVDIALAAHCVEQRVAGDLLLTFEIGDDSARRRLFNAFNFFAEAQGDTGVAEMVAESFDNLAVRELEQAVALLDERDTHAEDGEHAGVRSEERRVGKERRSRWS